MKMISGEGSTEAKIVIVGEAPGAKEEELGRPFVGRSGMLLDEALESCGIPRESVYITNLVKIRPPNNRDPYALEIEKFKPFLKHELELIKPKVVVTLGRIPACSFLGKTFKITRDRGIIRPTPSEYWVLPTYHPAYVNRNPNVKQQFFSDIEYAVKKAYE